MLQEGKVLIGGQLLGDTRQVTKSKPKKGRTKRAGTMVQVIAEGVVDLFPIVSDKHDRFIVAEKERNCFVC